MYFQTAHILAWVPGAVWVDRVQGNTYHNVGNVRLKHKMYTTMLEKKILLMNKCPQFNIHEPVFTYISEHIKCKETTIIILP